MYYTGDNDNLHCVAAQWAELVCKTNGEDEDPPDLATEIVDYFLARIGRSNRSNHPADVWIDWYWSICTNETK